MAEFSLIGSVSDVLGELADLSRRAGVPVVPLASSHAKLQRDIARQEGTASVHRLGVAVVLPLGLLVLPAFVLIAVVPTALAMWSGALV
jgi:tight adherence protein B